MNVLLMLATSLLAFSLQAQSDPLLGRWVLDAEASDDPAPMIDEAVQSVNRFARGRARGGLTSALTPAPTLELRMDGEAVLLSTDAGRSLRVVPGGEAVTIRTEQGDPAHLTAEREGSVLVLRSSSERGSRVQRLDPAGDALIVTTVNTFDFLDEPVRLRSVYRRGAR